MTDGPTDERGKETRDMGSGGVVSRLFPPPFVTRSVRSLYEFPPLTHSSRRDRLRRGNEKETEPGENDERRP